ncbi:MAG TPA: glycosyltransferase family 4 protein [Actinomycetota bacterium]
MTQRSAALVVPGGLAAVTGGNLYDRYVIDSLERHGWRITVVEPGDPLSTPAQVVVVDSLAFRRLLAEQAAPVVALAHQLPSAANNRPEWEAGERELLASASLVIVVAEHLREAIKDWTRAPVEVIPPGRDHASAPGSSTRDLNTVLCVANAVPGKGVPEAISAFRGAGISGARLVVTGDHRKDRAEAQRVASAMEAARESVRLAGVVTGKELSTLYAEAGVLLTASRYEGWPIAIAEAMASGLPVAGFDAPGVNELVRSGRDGVLVELGDTRGLSRALRQLLEDPDRTAAMGGAARDRALGWPTWEETGERFRAALEILLETRA